MQHKGNTIATCSSRNSAPVTIADGFSTGRTDLSGRIMRASTSTRAAIRERRLCARVTGRRSAAIVALPPWTSTCTWGASPTAASTPVALRLPTSTMANDRACN